MADPDPGGGPLAADTLARDPAANAGPDGGLGPDGPERGDAAGRVMTAGLSDAQAQQRLAELDGLLGQLEQADGSVAEVAVAAVRGLAEVYGAALARVVALADGDARLGAGLASDELVSHLLILHGLHPEPATQRVARALEEVRPYLRSHGGEVELAGVDSGVAWIRLRGACRSCGSSAVTMERLITESVLASAPELTGVETVNEPAGTPRPAGGPAPGERPGGQAAGAPTGGRAGQPAPAALIPVESLLSRPGGAGLGGRAAEPERCELCGQQVPERHRHLLDTTSRELLCACRACTILFNRDQASRGRYRLVPARRQRLPELSPADLGVPVGLAFFVRRDDGSVDAHYPSPAGATRWQVDPARWEAAAMRCPTLGDASAEVEAVLVNTAGGSSQAWLTPIDDCYRLVGLVRRNWEGMSGGSRVWPEIKSFFDELGRCDGADPGGQGARQAGHAVPRDRGADGQSQGGLQA